MSSIYDKSSLVLIPSGTKTSKVYSQKPVNGDGDFTFSRSTAATRVNADGNIEKETQNLLIRSNEFDNAIWGKFTNTTYTITTETITDPFGASASVYKVSLTGNGYVTLRQNLNGETRYMTASAYIKKSSSGLNVALDQSDGDVTNSASNTDWQRLSSSHASGYSFSFIDITITGVSGDYFYVSSAQMELGGAARDYIETTTAAVEGGITDNVPRLDYTDSSCPALLLEPQRTNIVPNSEYLGDWSLTNGTLTSNATISPQGVQNAGRVVFNNTALDLKRTIAVTASTTYTFSFYIKKESGAGLQGRFYDNSNGANIEYYDYTSQISGTNWSRVTRQITTPAGCTQMQIWLLATSSSIVTASFWGAQLESGSYATSYIPTYGTSVSRAYENQDATGLNSSVFNNDNLTLFYDFDYNAEGREGSTTAYRIFSGSSQLGIKGISGSSRGMEIYSSGDFSGSIVFNNIANASRIKVALRVTNGTCELFFNGAKDTETIDVSAAAPYSWGQVTMLASSSINTSLNQCLGFPTALTDQELIDLTTL